MLIAIISDSHDNLENLKKFIDWSLENKIEKIICLGDVAKTETIKYLALSFLGEIFLVKGNACLYKDKDLEKYKNIKYYGEIGQEIIGDLKIAFVHEPEKIKKLTEYNLDFVFYGHTHKPWLEKKGETFIANPGTLGGVYYQATFAVLNTETRNLELRGLK
ncbi:metallophosphoesterase family protein [Patescibacteria group bacterium]|nr:metallophosphoesterase family protein [Patescibacteria group bacterium]